MSTITSPQPDPTTDARTVPGALVAAIGGTAALAASNTCFAVLTADGRPQDTRQYLELVRAHPVLVEVGCALGLLACLLVVPAIWAVAARLQQGATRLAAMGAWLMSSGYVMGVALSVESLVALSVAGSGQDASGYVDAVDHGTTIVGVATYSVFGLGTLLGGLVLGAAMLRTGTVPRWCGIALVASEPVRVCGLVTGVDGLTAVASLLLLVGFTGALRHGGRSRVTPHG